MENKIIIAVVELDNIMLFDIMDCTFNDREYFDEIEKGIYYCSEGKFGENEVNKQFKLKPKEYKAHKFIVTPDNIVDVIKKYDILKKNIKFILNAMKEKQYYGFVSIDEFFKVLKKIYPEFFV